jgi:hypothetical protein
MRLRYRDYLLQEMRAGRLSAQRFHNRIKRACKRYREDAEARAYYAERDAIRTRKPLPEQSRP